MAQEKRITQEDIDNAEVRLSPIFGQKPRDYLRFVFFLGLAVLAFLFGVLPGILHYGTVVTFRSDPPGAAVSVDGTYRASTPCEIFVPAGLRSILIEYPGFAPAERNTNFGGRLFLSLFMPARARIDPVLTLNDANALLAGAQAEFAAWNLVGKPADSYQLPMTLSDAAAARFADPTAGVPDAAERVSFALAAARNAAYAETVRDATRAVALLNTGGAAASPVSALAVAESCLQTISLDPTVLSALERALPADKAEKLRSTKAFANAKPSAVPRKEAGPALPGATLADVRFVSLPGGTHEYSPEGSPAASLRLESFLLSRTEITRAQYARFIAAKPEWAPERRDELVSRGLVDEHYLENWSDGASSELPVTGVSRHAALAYCDWLSSFAPTGWRVALPTEIQWEYAAARNSGAQGVFAFDGASGPAPVGSKGTGAAGLADLLGNVWELCSDSYVPFPTVGMRAAERYPGPEYSVRGGSWANPRESVDLESRGSFPPDFSSPFLGFRPALVRTGN